MGYRIFKYRCTTFHGIQTWFACMPHILLELSYYFCDFLGPYISGYLSNMVGRKPCLFLGGGITLVGFALKALASHIGMILAGRATVGLGTGIIFVMNLVYIGEIA